MALVPVYNCYHPVLRQKAEKVEKIDAEVKQLVTDLFDTLYNIDNGVGLAANQIGNNKAVLVIDTSMNGKEEGSGQIVMINPEILASSKETVSIDEGCLSVPELYEPVVRSESITVKFYDMEMKEYIEEVDDFLARVILHEVDHLNGILFFDHLSPLRKTLSKSKLNKLAKGKIIPGYDMVQPDGTLTKGESDE
jgi:peptide deformylase